MSDKYKAVWVSFSSISDFIKCPRSYYLKNIYRNPKTNNKIEIVTPALALGSSVHSVLEPLSKISPQTRFEADLIELFNNEFLAYHGDKGGFDSEDEFNYYKLKGHKMLQTVLANKAPLEKPTCNTDKDLIDHWLSEKNNIVICGKIDWINRNEDGTLSVIDFKTSKEEDINDQQLQIYALLLFMLNRETVNKLYYWFLDINDDLTETNLPNVKEAYEKVLELAIQIREARASQTFECPRNGCFYCRDYERIVKGEAKQVGVGNYGREVYIIQNNVNPIL